MVDFDKDRDANLAAFELTGGAAAGGLTVRDYFAAKALNGLLTHIPFNAIVDPQRYVRESYEWADEMMAGRDRKPQQPCSVEEAFGLEK